MKIAIIGAGNMGSAIAEGILKSGRNDLELVISNPSQAKLSVLSESYQNLKTTSDNLIAVNGADLVIFAVKPHILPLIAEELTDVELPRLIVSIVAGIATNELESMFGKDRSYFYIIPNTAIKVGKGISFIAHKNAGEKDIRIVEEIFGLLGKSVVIEERLMSAATALCSCGIAYAYKFVQAFTQAGVELGFKPQVALSYSIETISGAMKMLDVNGTDPQTEINRVTTPGGMTIKGINMLEKTGFTASVIKSILEPIKK